MSLKIIRPSKNREVDFRDRWRFLRGLMMVAMVSLVGRAMYLQVFNQPFLQKQADLKHVGIVSIPANRGQIVDRNGEPLAADTPVKSIWADPKDFADGKVSPEKLKSMADLLGMPAKQIIKSVGAPGEKHGFEWIKRRVDPETADRVLALSVPGVAAMREYRRHYPAGEITAHIVGATNIDQHGQEGMELAFDKRLRGQEGHKRVLKDGKRRVIEDLEDVRPSIPGSDLTLSIDQRIQYRAFIELKKTVEQNRAKSGSLVLLDAQNGEVLAMVNQPTYDPNKGMKVRDGNTRNRAVTDLFEPGSTMKPFAVACALELGLVRPDAYFSTSGGLMKLGRYTIRDTHAYGSLSVTGILQKSSNVGVTKIALTVPPNKFHAFFNNLGFGQPLETGFPGEAHGLLQDYHGWNQFEQATLAFGYGASTSLLQLARAYLAIANDGVMPMVTMVKRDKPAETHRIMSARTAVTVRNMLEQVVSKEGTAIKASIPGFRVAGKTGTVKKNSGHGYAAFKHLSLFAGMAPASKPRLVMVVMIDEPTAGEYYGGAVAAPVFASVMEAALRMLNVAPDDEQEAPSQPIMAGKQDDHA